VRIILPGLRRGANSAATVTDDGGPAAPVVARAGVLVILVQKVTLSKFLILLGNRSASRATSLICFDLLLFVAVFDHSG